MNTHMKVCVCVVGVKVNEIGLLVNGDAQLKA